MRGYNWKARSLKEAMWAEKLARGLLVTTRNKQWIYNGSGGSGKGKSETKYPFML
jgi:hypothetical protein